MMKNSKPLVIIGVPIDLGVKKLGVDMGPTAIRYAGIYDALDFGGFTYQDSGDIQVLNHFALRNPWLNTGDEARLQEISRVAEFLGTMVYEAANNGEIPIILGGDHSVSIGSIAGLAKTNRRIGLLWIDAHPDANTPETSPTGNVHGMTVAISLGFGHKELVNCMEFHPKVRPEDICIVGAKDIDRGELAFLKKMGIRYFTTYDIAQHGINRVMKEAIEIVATETDAIYVSFDMDVLDCAVAPGTGIENKGGIEYRELSYITHVIGQELDIACLDIIEVNPLLDIRNQTAELSVEVIMGLLGVKYTTYEKKYLGGKGSGIS